MRADHGRGREPMNVLIAGGGQVGALIARRLIREGNAVTIVDPSPERCAELDAQLDARIVTGNAARVLVLREAGIAAAEMVIAVTDHDEVNLLVLPDRAGRVEGQDQGAAAADPRGAALARRAGQVGRARRPDHPSRNRTRREHHAGDPAARRVGRPRVRGRRGAPGGDDPGRRQPRHRPDARAAVGRGAAGGFAGRDDLPRPAGDHPARVGGAAPRGTASTC